MGRRQDISSAVQVARAPGVWERFWTSSREIMRKAMNDWILNLAGLLAYTLLLSSFPLLLVLLALAGALLGTANADQLNQFIKTVAQSLPGGVGEALVESIVRHLTESAGLTLIFGVLSALFFGSRLFVTIENCFCVIYRVPSRPFAAQHLMALGLLLIYVLLMPVAFITSALVTTAIPTWFPSGDSTSELVLRILGAVASPLLTILLVGLIYVVVPNRPIRWREVWRGTLLASALIVLYELLFPLYQTQFLHLDNYGSIVGFAIVVVVFYYYLAFILLLGVEVNSWVAGLRAADDDIPGILYAEAKERRATGDRLAHGREDGRRADAKGARR